MSKKKSVIKLFFVFFLFVFAGNYVFAADSSESCSNYDTVQYRPYGTCGTEERTCCSSSGKYSNWGEDCTCGENECYITYANRCVERCSEGLSEAKSSKCNYHGTYTAACGYGPSSICKTLLVGTKPCKCDTGYTGTYCDKKAVTYELLNKNAAVESIYASGMYSMFVFVCDNLIKHSVSAYPSGTYTTYSCGDGENYSISGNTANNTLGAVTNLKNNLCNTTQYQTLCEEKGADYHCVLDISPLYWNSSGSSGNYSSYYDASATVLKCKEAI